MIDFLIMSAPESIFFLLLNVPLIIGAYSISKKVAGNVFYLKIAMTILLYLLQMTGIFLLLGYLGILNNTWALVGSLLSCGLLLFAAHKLPDTLQEPFSSGENFSQRFLSCMTAFAVSMIAVKTSAIAGTDAFLYHLFYPEMWLNMGKIFPITLTGLSHEYFPIAGEVMYGFLMQPGTMQPFYTLLQPLALIMALLAAAGLWQLLKVPKLYINSGMLLLPATCIIMENASIVYTDVLTGAFLTTGTAFTVIAFKNLADSPSKTKILSGCAGIALGITAGIKYSGLVMAPIMGLVLLLIFITGEIRAKTLKKNLVKYEIFAVSALFSAAIFYLANWVRTGNPFYPVRIPLIFDKGIDFEHPPVKISELWSFYVTDNIWDLNTFTALFYLGIICLIIFFVLKSFLQKNVSCIIKVQAAVLTAALAGETVMLLIYPAMTGARQIIPFLSVTAMLLAGTLYLTADKFVQGKKSIFIYLLIISMIGFFMLKNHHNLNSVIAVLFALICSAILAIFKSRKALHKITILWAVSFVIILNIFSFMVWYHALFQIKSLTGDTNYKIIEYLRNKYIKHAKPLYISSCGYLFNYLLLQDMPGNRVFNIPINQIGTTHPHEVEKLEDLRENNIDYQLWLERLKKKKIRYLVIDINSYQDFPRNRTAELEWAKANSETFVPIISENGFYLYELNY